MADRRRRTATLAVTLATLAVPALGGCSLVDRGDDGGGVSVFSVQPGQCFRGQGEVKAQISTLTEVACTEDHAQESYAVVRYQPPAGTSADTYPGDDALTKFAEGACAGAYKKYVGIDYLDSTLFYTYLLPSARSWDDDDRSVVCFVTSPGEPLQRSVKGSRL